MLHHGVTEGTERGEGARAGHFADPDRLTPLYLRRPEAEEKWEQLGR